MHVGLYVWLLRLAMQSRNPYGIVLLAVLVAFFVRNLAESNGVLFGLFNNLEVFLSWYVLASLLVLVELQATLRINEDIDV
jgi:hypothetical protein